MHWQDFFVAGLCSDLLWCLCVCGFVGLVYMAGLCCWGCLLVVAMVLLCEFAAS